MNSMYFDFVDRLDRIFTHGYDPIRVSEVLSDLYQNRVLFLSELSNSEMLMETVKKNSGLHESGFNRFIVMLSKTHNWSLRMNVWMDDVIPRLRNSKSAHNHRWNHTSVVLYSSMLNFFFDPQVGSDYFEYITTMAGSEFTEAKLVGTGNLQEANILRICQGETYYQRSEQFHRIYPEGDGLATFCLQCPTGETEARMFSQIQWKGTRIDYPDWRTNGRFEKEWLKSVDLICSSPTE